MSKASEWADRFRAMDDRLPPPFRDRRIGTHLGPYLGLSVMQDGYCRVEKNGEWVLTAPPDVILAAARWILDTFGDQP